MAEANLRADSAPVTPIDNLAAAADQLQAHLRRIASLNSAVDHETDFAADSDREQILGRLGRVCDFSAYNLRKWRRRRTSPSGSK